jgi:acyl-CoA synthetase (AMP-forming)/AMP-acid ligase II
MFYKSDLLQPLLDLADKQPNFIVLESKHSRLSAKQLLQKSMTVAAQLKKMDFQMGDIAIMAAQPGETFLVIMYALLMLQGKIAIIDPEMGSANYSAKMQQLQAKWLFADTRLLFLREHPIIRWFVLRRRKNIPDIRQLKGMKVIAVGHRLPLLKQSTHFQRLLKRIDFSNTFSLNPKDNEALIVYTSGTLSVPKGVVHTTHNLHCSINALKKVLNAQPNEIVGTSLPHFMLLGVSAGLTVKAMPPFKTAAEKLKWLEDQKINILFGPPSDFLALIQHSELNGKPLPSSLSHLLIGSAPVHQSFLNRLLKWLPSTTRVTCTYGMTEHLLVSVIDGREKVNYTGEGDVLGMPIPGIDLKLTDEGEILVRSEQLFKRYFHLETREDWHATGDLGTIDDAGNIVLLGRAKEMIIRGNFNIYPALYEDTIKKIPGVEEAAFVGIYDAAIHDEKVYLAVETNKKPIDQIRQALMVGKYSIDKEALPDVIISMKIPRKGRQNKLDRHAIVDYIKKHNL